MSLVFSEAITVVERALICEAVRDEIMDIDTRAFAFVSGGSENKRDDGAVFRVRDCAGAGARRVPFAQNNR